MLGWMRVDDAHSDPQLLFGKSDWHTQIRVIGDDHGDVAGLLEGIEEQVGGQVHVRSLLLGLDHLDRPGTCSGWMSKPHAEVMGEEVSVMDADQLKCPQRTKVRLLSLSLPRITGAARDPSCEVANPVDFVLGE